MSAVECLLDRIFPHEDLPFGRRWRLFGSYVTPGTVPALLKRGLPWFGERNVYLHKMVRPDADRHLHSHPYMYASIILSGGYMEMVKQGDAVRPNHCRPGQLAVASAERYHRISRLPSGTCWTLFFAGKPRWMAWKGKFIHDWGFMKGAFHVPWPLYKDGGM
jgi:hypothetical protein